MTLSLTDDHARIIEAPGHVLVTGGPGSGKTTVALLKAKARIDQGLATGQSILFLSFSRAAVGRVIEAAQADLPTDIRARLDVQTFHAFFWELLRTHGYLLGAPRKLRLFLPHDEAARLPDFQRSGPAWHAELERLFRIDGLVAFDLFAPKVLEILNGSTGICAMTADRFPLIVVDEAQDTADDQWACIRRLSERTTLACLADLEQQIYDFRPNVSSQRVIQIMEQLRPLRVDFGPANHRSPANDILAFGNDILLNTPRGRPYAGVTLAGYPPRAVDRDKYIRSSIGRIRHAVERAKGSPAESIAVLASWGRGVLLVSRALAEAPGRARIPHHPLIDEAPVLLAGRVIAYLLEPIPSGTELADLAAWLELIATVLKAKDTAGDLTQARRLLAQATQARDERTLARSASGHKALGVLRDLRTTPLSGDPRQDWLRVRNHLKNSDCGVLVTVAGAAEQLFLLGRGQHLATGLTAAWQRTGTYADACRIYDSAVAEDQILSGGRDSRGISVMTLHKAKGKEFDGVVILDEFRNCPLVLRGDAPPYPRSRRLLRVGITRARYHVLILHSVIERPLLLDANRR